MAENENNKIKQCEELITSIILSSKYFKIRNKLNNSNLLIKCLNCSNNSNNSSSPCSSSNSSSPFPSNPSSNSPSNSSSNSNYHEIKAQAYLETNPLQIIFCSNKIELKRDVYEQILKHELIHAYDYIFNRCDFKTCNGLAYSEIRAARDGECSGYHIHDYFKNKCIKDHAINSTAV